MTGSELLKGQMDWVARNMSHNLGFIADDKLGWKPAPEAKSALEIINHVVDVISYFVGALGGEKHEFAEATTREEAQNNLRDVANEYSKTLENAAGSDMRRLVTTPFGEIEWLQVASMAVADTIYHHGQITYIQTLLGDTESHLEI